MLSALDIPVNTKKNRMASELLGHGRQPAAQETEWARQTFSR